MALTKNELEEVIEELGQFKGRHTEFITVYISAGYDAVSVQKQLEAEKSTAKNIKSTSTRKNVVDALEKIVRALKEYKRTPENGLVIFAGNVSKVEGQSDLRIWEIEPPLPLKMRLYRCDKEFVLDALKEMMEVTEIYGLLVMDRKEATIGMLEGKRIECLHKMTSGIPSKVRAGGQCLSPDTLIVTKKGIRRIIDLNIGDEIKAFDLISKKIVFTKVKNKWKKSKNKYQIIILKNCLSVVSSLDHAFFKDVNNIAKETKCSKLRVNDNLITFYDNKLNILAVKDIIEVNEKISLIDIETESKNFFANGFLVHNSSQRFHRITEGLTKDFYKRIAEEMKKTFFENKKLKGILVGGPIPTKDEFLDGEYMATQLREKVVGRVDIGDTDESGLKELVQKAQDILANQEIIYEKKLLEKFFQTLGEKPDLAAYKEEGIRKALQYGAVETLILSKELDKAKTKELKKLAEGISSKVEIVSTETTEGEQFQKLSGMGALLRFRI